MRVRIRLRMLKRRYPVSHTRWGVPPPGQIPPVLYIYIMVLLDNVSVQENAPPDASDEQEPDCEPDEDPPIGNFTDDLTIAQNFNHNIDADFENETLPPSEQFFDNTYELKFEALEKKRNNNNNNNIILNNNNIILILNLSDNLFSFFTLTLLAFRF